MPLHYFHKNRLSKIKSLLDPSLLNRGYTLFREGKVDFCYLDPSTEVYFFDVAGNIEPSYAVSICLESHPGDELNLEKGLLQFLNDPGRRQLSGSSGRR
ncbi:hypothetical protein [Cyclobacterium lianum]|nr:hypothetical protein [Cyclobacterium lianum]